MHIIIPGQTRAKKNGMMIVQFGKGPKAKRAIRSSKLYYEWEKAALKHLKSLNLPPWPGDYPVEVCFFLFRKNKVRWDIDNVFCGCLDVLQQVGILKDDSANHVIPVCSGWAIDRKNPRAELLIRPITKQYYREDLYVGN